MSQLLHHSEILSSEKKGQNRTLQHSLDDEEVIRSQIKVPDDLVSSWAACCPQVHGYEFYYDSGSGAAAVNTRRKGTEERGRSCRTCLANARLPKKEE
jgi:hypothetical protein